MNFNYKKIKQSLPIRVGVVSRRKKRYTYNIQDWREAS